MIARGPTFGADGETVTGNLHVLGLPSAEAAREFVAGEPMFLLIARGGARVPLERLATPLRERLILYGALSMLD
ncbi:MAG: hypothetical protein ABI317_04225, partial [Gaiellales bacterium]